MATDEEVIEVKGFGIEGRARGRRLSTPALLLAGFCSLAAFGYQHDKQQSERLNQIHESMVENTYVLSLSQARREELNIAMPESLRRKIRPREQ